MKIDIGKILSNYNYSVQKYDKISKSRYWEQSIKKKKNLFNKKRLKDFRRNYLSHNIDEYYLTQKQFNNLFFEIKKKIENKNFVNFLESKNIGNAKIYKKYRNKFVTPSDLFHIYYLNLLKKNINLKKNVNTVCEIGQGFGLFASKMLKIKKFKTILIDLPESNLITAFFLGNIIKKKIILDQDLENNFLTKEIFDKNEIFIISPWVKISKNIKIDLFINMRSMMEMTQEAINNYFELIKKNITKNGYFYCVNRYYKDLVGYPIELHNYPFDKKWYPVFSKQSRFQKNSHILILKRNLKKKKDIINCLSEVKTLCKLEVKKDKFFLRRISPLWLYSIYKKIKFNVFKL